ncbi:MAG: O-antigen ligase family protein, partial [Candidatus Omnitrophica bacterium]|nr:O-antigen ligase family protein [Candidatus Omnitrophota bacterium]
GLQRAYENLFSQMTRLYTSFNIPAFFAAYFLYSIPLFLIVILLHSNLRIKLLAGIGITPLAICLFFHFSRSTWIVLSLSVFIYFLFLNGHKWMGVFIAYLILSVIFVLPPFRERLFSTLTLSPSTWGDRVAMWDSAFNIFKEFPFFGVGPGNYSSYMYKVIPVNLYKEGLRHLHAHDTFLEILAETGLFGLTSFLFIFFTFFKHMLKRIKKRENYIDIAFFIMAIAVLLGELTASTIMVGVYNACLFWFLMGLAVGRRDDTENA